MLRQGSSLRGIGLMLAAMFMFTLNDMMMKMAAGAMSPLQVLLVRGFFASVLVFVAMIMLGRKRRLSDALHPLVVLRGLFELTAAIFYVAALTRFPIGDVVAITQTYPLLLLPLGVLWFGETMSLWRALLALGGFVGALMVVQPGAAGFDPLILIAFGTAIALVGRDLLAARLPRTLSSLAVTLATVVIPMLGGAIGMIFIPWEAMSNGQVGLLAASGVMLAFAHGLVFMAFQSAPIRDIAPFAYACTLFAVLAGIVIFGDRPSQLTLAGMALLVLCGALLATQTRRTA